MTARAPVYIDSGKLHVFEDGDTLPPWLSPSSMAWENLTGMPAGITQLSALTGPGYAKVDAAGAWSVQAAIPQADVSGLTTALAGLQPISARLTAIAGLTDAAGWLHDDGSGNWALTTPTKSDVGLGNVENTALSTWGGSANLVTLGTVTTGVWHGTSIADAYISSAATWNAKEGALGNPSTSGYLLSSTGAGVRSWVAPYSLPTATASVLGGVKVGTGLAISSGALSASYGTAAGTACVGNDSRLSDSRTPTAHALDGALHTISGKTAGQVLVATGATTFGFATISGDAALSGAGALTLATLLTVGSAGSATTVPTLTWDAKGRLTSAGSAAISIPHTQINDWAASVSSVYLPLAGGTMTAGAKIRTLQDMTINTGANVNYSSAPFVAQRYTSDSTTTTHASIGFHNIGVNAAALFYHAGNSNFWFNDHNGGLYQLWSSKDFSQGWITNWTTAYNWGNHASAGYLLSSTAASTYLPIGGTASNASALGGVAADNFVQGNGDQPWGTRTTRLLGSPTALTQGLKSGFYDNDGTNSSGTPTGGWCHMIVNAHTGSTPKKQYQWELASGFWDGEIYSRTISLGAVSAWKTLIHSANYPSFNNFTSGLTTTTLTASDLITANGGISGNLTGHASLDIPLTGSSAITGMLTSSNSSNLGSAALQWGSIYGSTIYEDGTSLSSKYQPLENQRLSTNSSPYFTSLGVATTGNVSQYLIGLNADGSISQRKISGEAFIVATPSVAAWKTLTYAMSDGGTVNITLGGRLTAGELYVTGPVVGNLGMASGTFTPTVINVSTAITIDATCQGKMVVVGSSATTATVVTFPASGPFAGFWFFLSFRATYSENKYGPASGYWWLNGTSQNQQAGTPFSGIVSWTGREWVAG